MTRCNRRSRMLPGLLGSLALLLVSTSGFAQPPASGSTPKPTPGSATSPNAAPILDQGQTNRPRSSEASPLLKELNASLEALVERISPAVVQIQVTGYGAVEEGIHRQTAVVARQHAIGSGVIVDANGYIITNAHVVEGARRIRVLLPMPAGEFPQVQPIGKERVKDAQVIGVHKESDLALLKIAEKGLPTLSLASAGQVRQGQLVFALGSPEGLQNSVTMGVVSAVGRQPDPESPMVYIQTDAPINPGNSGGPLVDTDGSVLGINTLILSQGGGSEGLGFAIPARIVRFVYQSLRKYGHVHRVEIQAATQNITPALAEGLGLSEKFGVIVCDVTPGGPAAAAGLEIGDIVVSADGRPIATLPALMAALYLHPLDEVLKMVVKRGSEQKTLLIPVSEHRDPMDKLMDEVDPEKSLVEPLGILAVDLDDQFRSVVGSLRIPTGVIVIARAAELLGPETGLRTGDVIHSLNGKPVDSVEQLRGLLKNLSADSPLVLQIERDSQLEWLAFEME
ncbi:MAG TPA: trypsin-like peptidase domain-containing protein [Terriglobales bacterium]|nr:trypsin-like peptidase domain-containing protein [Terriglobales bacterium]